jgi:hypothetical protein
MNTDNSQSKVVSKAIKSLELCEGQIYGLVGDAAKNRDSDGVAQLNELAQALGRLRDSLTAGDSIPVLPLARTTVRASETAKPRNESRSTKRRRTSRPEGYPRFAVEGNSLVKVSWSKTKNSEYIHKAPKRVLDKLIEVILELGGNGEVVPTDTMFPLADGDDQYPDYQSYLCLLWLKQKKLVEHHGREGYQIRDPKSFVESCDRLWHELDS